jgi:hypothetical protein
VNKKLFLIIGAVCLVAVLILWFFFRPSAPAEAIPPIVTDACLVFQSDDSMRPCFLPAGPVSTEKSTASTSQVGVICDQGSVFEKNDCVSKVAQESKDKSLCSAVQGSLAQAACLRGTGDNGISTVMAAPQNTYESFLKTIAATTIDSTPRPVAAMGITETTVSPEEKAKTSIEGFYERLSTKASLLAYTVFPYQSRPGDVVKVQGSGFALDATNVVYFGGVGSSAVASADGMTLMVTVPSAAQYGAQEIWVTNARGSSRVAERPIQVVISQNPLSAPRITAFSPEKPLYTDTITISGENMSEIKGIYTSFGEALGNSHSFRVSDLRYAHLVTDKPSNKGMVVPVYVYAMTEGGLSEEPFLINVQF